MLDHVARTIGYGCPMPFITWVFRCSANLLKLTDFRTNFWIIVTALTPLGFSIRTMDSWIGSPPNWYFSTVSAFFFLSLGVNAIVTALIVYKIITVSNNIRRLRISTDQGSAPNGSGQLNLSPLVSILIESGLITFVAQLAQSIMYKFVDFAFPLVGGFVVILYVRLHVDFFVDLVVIFSSTYYYTGNFDVSCPCACEDGRFLRC